MAEPFRQPYLEATCLKRRPPFSRRPSATGSRAGLGAAGAPARPARQGARGPLRPARGADRRRQDARRVPAEPRGALGAGTRPGHGQGQARAPHPLHLAPEGARHRRRPQSRNSRCAEMGLPVRIETRTGDTPSHKRARQIERPPDILLTTPEQLALLLAHRGGAGASSRTCAGWCSTSCIPSSPRSAAICSRWAWHG